MGKKKSTSKAANAKKNQKLDVAVVEPEITRPAVAVVEQPEVKTESAKKPPRTKKLPGRPEKGFAQTPAQIAIRATADRYAKISAAGAERVRREIDRINGEHHDPLEAIIRGGLAPDYVLPPPGDVGSSGRIVNVPPIYNLRHRVPADKAISHEQYEAAARYKKLNDQYLSLPSNIASTLARMEDQVQWTAKDVSAIQSGDMMRPGKETRIPNREMKTPQVGVMVQSIDNRLPPFDRAILRAVVINELPLQYLARQLKVPAEALGLSVRVALWSLVASMEIADFEFRTWLVQSRSGLDTG